MVYSLYTYSWRDKTFEKIILELDKKGRLTRAEVARIVEPEFPFIPRPEKYKFALKGADTYAKILERNGMVIRANYKGREYTLQITEKGKKCAQKLRESESDESS